MSSEELTYDALAAIKQTIGQETIEKNFDLSSQDFQIITAIRYDPRFTHVFEPCGNGEDDGYLSQLDPQLTSLIDSSSFLQSNDSEDSVNGLLDYLDSSSVTSSPISEGFELGARTAIRGDLLFQSVYGNNYVHSQSTNHNNGSVGQSNGTDLWSIYYDRFLFLGEHYKRLKLAMTFFQWKLELTPRMLLTQLIYSLPSQESLSIEDKMKSLLSVSTPYKLRLLLSKDGTLKVEAHELPEFETRCSDTHEYIVQNLLSGYLDHPPVWDVFINPEPIVVSPFTTFKTTKREHYNKARENMELLRQKIHDQRPKSEILVYNDLYQLMEGSVTNVAVKSVTSENSNSFRYTTPTLSSGCLCGVTRYFLLRKGLLQEDSIDVRDLSVGDEVLLFNAVNGCVKGVIRNSVDFSNI
ncbi:unnamed protein product [Kluyveromyces dobzhanskii CBS 2104]|uniref:WGS project CCBQ000000000 data, contig 00107 n=1 Tax=Kluyveromyces dobzhanskii CBS 2104 TaxID=1427455 RepID=A0A0A8L1D4_9SACH|nr:unnamed protein product [Kluyveromyces dobzhanskii CBS 2104]